MKIDGLTPDQLLAKVALLYASQKPGLAYTPKQKREFCERNGIPYQVHGVAADNNRALVQFALECLGWSQK